MGLRAPPVFVWFISLWMSSKCICHPERSEGSRVHKRGCFRDSSSLRSSEWQECLRWH
jgi:hypothetical protein